MTDGGECCALHEKPARLGKRRRGGAGTNKNNLLKPFYPQKIITSKVDSVNWQTRPPSPPTPRREATHHRSGRFRPGHPRSRSRRRTATAWQCTCSWSRRTGSTGRTNLQYVGGKWAGGTLGVLVRSFYAINQIR